MGKGKKENIGCFKIGNHASCKLWESPEDLQCEIDAYFESCNKNLSFDGIDSQGKEKYRPDPIPYTIEGLCETLDCDRKTILNYEKREGYEAYFHTIKKAKMKVQRQKVEKGLSNKSNAAITMFDLNNNHDYKHKTEHSIEDKREKTIKLEVIESKEKKL